MAHALLSPSSASQWLACPPSARLQQSFPDRAGEAAAEGTLAHSLGETIIGYKVGHIKKPVFRSKLKEIQKSQLYNEAMMSYMEDYASFVIEQYELAKQITKDALIALETRLDMSDYVPEGFGTGDVNIVADHVLGFIDLKYGKGVKVDARENKQMMLYALGALKAFSHLYDIQEISMTIYQPRMDNISTWSISVKELLQWAEEHLRPKAELAFAGKGEYAAGRHCQFCRAKAVCRANAEYQLEGARNEFTDPVLLSDEEVSEVLKKSADLKKWLTSVEDYALMEAIHNERQWPGMKLVEGRSNRKYINTELVSERLLKAGFSEEIIFKPKEIRGITDLEKAVGKKMFAETVSDLLDKPPGAPTLALEEDPRPVYSDPKSAKSDFASDFAD